MRTVSGEEPNVRPVAFCPKCHAKIGTRRRGVLRVGKVLFSLDVRLMCSNCGQVNRYSPRR